MQTFTTQLTLGLAVLACSLGGCTGKSATNGAGAQPTATQSKEPGGGHVHPTEGPHGGELIELGNEEYHAELLHDDDTGTVTIYILNEAADEQVAIDESEITVNAKQDGQPAQFKLAATPDASDSPGRSSRFVSNDNDLATLLDEHEADPRLVLAIKGKSYRGLIAHDRPHD